MTDLLLSRLQRLDNHRNILENTQRGIEKEGLRVNAQGQLSQAPHPVALGAALTHPHITTDYSEALLELITDPFPRTDDVLSALLDTHRATYAALGDELIWNHSMPARLPADQEIPIAWYGTSNSGMLKHVYRRGLAVRYGRSMQCIAGIHYNFSLDDAIWPLLDLPGANLREQRDAGYIALVRNFTRASWLLMYLFGASPAIASNFPAVQNGGLERWDADTCFLPHATSLRMSDLGYQNKAQSQLKLNYNDLETFLDRLYNAVTTPWPAYEAFGTKRDGEWIQLNTNVLQIENEYYSNIRLKRSTKRCERPLTALDERGVQYVEVRCLDIDPFEPAGISADTMRFMDAFLLYCTLDESPAFAPQGYCERSSQNFAKVVRQGREPGLMLERNCEAVSLQQWGKDILDRVEACAELLDRVHGSTLHRQAVAMQRAKLEDPALTPSARLLAGMRDTQASFFEYGLSTSRAHADALRSQALDAATQAHYQELAAQSLAEQHALEADRKESFDEYVARYHANLQRPHRKQHDAA
ncbi:glutamate--cysteine ligase [Kerstersia gyiorum]|uniref:glutamate--cysteine ligase n=1 Tax=Kerstersia gyiorum TaxID=206506 RepID=UPI00242F9DBE|nr:glutamate--cysteine ligase [Kerstersia gyiorum]MCH4270670.1 glutamate--cysteine ligase [Kerstersia gyiorum]MCI1230136.1 glutamate--cysteine ligase [Kerstersia gyiorum]